MGFVKLRLAFIRDCFRSQEQLKSENTALRHQLNVQQRKGPKRPPLSGSDKALFVWLYRLFLAITGAIRIVQPETVIGWHRAGFRAWWRWKSRNRGGRPKVDQVLRDLIRRMPEENPLWGAPRIHGELLKLGFNVAQSTVSKYITRTKTAVSRLEDSPAQSRGWHRGRRLSGRTDSDLPMSVRVCRAWCRKTNHPLDRSHDKSDRTMVGPSDHRSFSLGECAKISNPRQ